MTIGGNLINHPGDCGTPTADILTVKTLFNSIISTPHSKFMTINIKDFYLMTPMTRYEYFRMKLELIPQDVINETTSRTRSNQMATYIGKCGEACMVSHKQA